MAYSDTEKPEPTMAMRPLSALNTSAGQPRRNEKKKELDDTATSEVSERSRAIRIGGAQGSGESTAGLRASGTKRTQLGTLKGVSNADFVSIRDSGRPHRWPQVCPNELLYTGDLLPH